MEPHALRSHARFVLDEAAEMPAGLDEVRLDAGPAAVLHFKGPYSGLQAAYDYLYGVWLPQSGWEADDAPPYEVYLTDPSEAPPDELLTDILVPLR